jgi:hypothetical protein
MPDRGKDSRTIDFAPARKIPPGGFCRQREAAGQILPRGGKSCPARRQILPGATARGFRLSRKSAQKRCRVHDERTARHFPQRPAIAPPSWSTIS